MTINEIEKFFSDRHVKADIREQHDGSVIISTETAVPDDVQFALELVRPIGVRFLFSIKPKNRMAVPSTLKNWFKQTHKYLNEDK